ncbi:MAG: histidine kinase [Bacteroidales bacterium]|nr:histidine kinase [Bacteroidales bacterium]
MNNLSKKDISKFLSIKTIVKLSLIISIGFHLIFFLARFFGDNLFSSEFRPAQPRHHFEFERFMLFTALSFLMAFALFLLNRRVMRITFKKKYHELVVAILGSIVATAVLSIAFTLIPNLFHDREPRPDDFLSHIIRNGLVRDFTLMAIVILTAQLVRSLYEQRTIAVENEALRADNISTHYEALKSQLDPHFLFNSLNTLQSLIGSDKDKAEDYIQQLSCVLRSILQTKEVTTLDEEMKCVNAYCSMMKIRYGENLFFKVEIMPKYHQSKVLPLAIQGLIENAIKHNVISAKQPLTLSITTTDEGTIVVSNPIQPKLTEESGNGIGLANLAERYRLQWGKEIGISNDGNVFEVTLPLEENTAP